MEAIRNAGQQLITAEALAYRSREIHMLRPGDTPGISLRSEQDSFQRSMQFAPVFATRISTTVRVRAIPFACAGNTMDDRLTGTNIAPLRQHILVIYDAECSCNPVNSGKGLAA